MELQNLHQHIENPLVSIVVITYNSAKYVLESLESVKAQTYQNIELIVSDDCSTDDTIEMCQQWIQKNKKRFVRTQMITTKKNTGIAPNCNRGYYATKGKWLKFLAGDDMLLSNCISAFVNYILLIPNCKLLFGKVQFSNMGKISSQNNKRLRLTNQENQSKDILKLYNHPFAVSVIIHKDALSHNGGFDEKYPYCEDTPLFIKLVENGFFFYFLNEFVAIYRKQDESICSVGSKAKNQWINEKYYNSLRMVFINEVIPRQIKFKLYLHAFDLWNYIFAYDLIIRFGNKINLFSKFLSLLYLQNFYVRLKSLIKRI